jgi:hypothetical protein
MTAVRCAWLAVWLVLAATPASAQPEAIGVLLNRLETALASGDRQAFGQLTTRGLDDAQLRTFLDRWFLPETTHARLHERDRVERGGPDALRLTVEVLVEARDQARLATWRLDLQRDTSGWHIAAVTTLSVVEGLFRLALDQTTQYRARNLVVAAEDLELRLDDGVVFLANVPAGGTVAVLLGKGEMIFTPSPEAERRQIALLTGEPALRQPFEAATIRINPADQAARLPSGHLTVMPVDRQKLARAQDVFADEVGKSFSVDLADLSRDTWSLIPSIGNFLAEVRTRKYGTLTYAHDGSDPEDISVFDRARRRNLSIYSSKSKLATRGPFFNEDDGAEFDVLDYNVETTFVPERFWMEGRTRIKLKVKAYALSALTLRLADRLVVRSVSSDLHGRVLHIRVRNQNSLVVNLPEPLNRDDEVTLTVMYAGRHEPQGVDRENLAVAGQVQTREVNFTEPEPHYLYSNRSYWYAQAPQSDYATATIRFTVPAAYGTVCSGEQVAGSPVALRAGPEDPPRRLFVFAATTPLRYLSCVLSRFAAVDTRDVTIGQQIVPLRMTSTARQRTRGRDVLARTAEMMAFYGSLIGEAPYPSLSVAVLESQIPGGHAPGYVAIINLPLPTSPYVWRDDPASFDDFPDFFLAHELAHQWWGQAVGWQNYHEQWLSEGFAQYFAAMFAERSRGPEVFAQILRQLTRWALADSDQGPVYLGYRLGHLRGEGRVFRALVYNKGGAVLHMLRRELGDDAFLAGLRRFYREFKFRKASTEDLRHALEAESGRSLETFFARWIYGQDVPEATVKWQVIDAGKAVRIDLQQVGASTFEFPITVTRVYADGSEDSETVIAASAVTTLERPLKGPLRSVEINADRLTPIRVRK